MHMSYIYTHTHTKKNAHIIKCPQNTLFAIVILLNSSLWRRIAYEKPITQCSSISTSVTIWHAVDAVTLRVQQQITIKADNQGVFRHGKVKPSNYREMLTENKMVKHLKGHFTLTRIIYANCLCKCLCSSFGVCIQIDANSDICSHNLCKYLQSFVL